jgi:hypothetical protein
VKGFGYSGLIDFYTGSGKPKNRPAYATPGWSSQPSRGAPNQIGPSWEDQGASYSLDPAVLSRASNHVEFFARGTDGQMWHKYWDGASWNGPGVLGGACSTGPGVAARSSSQMDVFVVATDSQIWTTWWTAASGWAGGWAPMGGIGTSAPAACSQSAGHMEVFVRSTDNGIWHKWWSTAGGWAGGWAPLGGSASSAPAAVSRVNGRMDVFVLSGNQLYTTWYDAATGWAGGWASLGAPPSGCASSPAAACWGGIRVDVFVRANDGKLWRRFYEQRTDGSKWQWSGWEPVYGATVDSAAAVVSRVPGQYDLFARRGVNIVHNWQA